MTGSISRTSLFLGITAAVLTVCVVVSAQEQRPQSADKNQAASPSSQKPARFDMLVRDDFFAGMFHGDKVRFNRALKFTEDTLAKDPKNGDAWVWLGSAHIQLSSKAYTAGDSAKGKNLWDQGLREMDKGVALDPGGIGVHIGRGAPLLGFASSGYDPSDPESRAIVTKAVGDYEFALAKQAPYFDKLDRHSRGELLFGLATGWSMLGNEAKARSYLAQIAKNLPHSPYETEAQSALAKNPLGIVEHNCVGCHVD